MLLYNQQDFKSNLTKTRFKLLGSESVCMCWLCRLLLKIDWTKSRWLAEAGLSHYLAGFITRAAALLSARSDNFQSWAGELPSIENNDRVTGTIHTLLSYQNLCRSVHNNYFTLISLLLFFLSELTLWPSLSQTSFYFSKLFWYNDILWLITIGILWKLPIILSKNK